ncbi:MAG: hypothetical protein ACYTF0_05245 [Planctomycetota bacterium]|jgi:hypothetical protein
MHALSVVAKAGASDCQVIVVGHAAIAAPAAVEREAARLAQGKAGATSQLVAG